MLREESMYLFRCARGGFPAVICARVTLTIACSFLREGEIDRVGTVQGEYSGWGGGDYPGGNRFPEVGCVCVWGWGGLRWERGGEGLS